MEQPRKLIQKKMLIPKLTNLENTGPEEPKVK